MPRIASILTKACLIGAAALVGCKKEEVSPPEVPPLPPLADSTPSTSASQGRSAKAPPLAPGQNQMPPGHPEVGMSMPKVEAGDVELEKPVESSAGIKFTTPKGWQAVKPAAPSNSAFAVAGPVAVFKLEKVNEKSSDAIVRLTHFPGMKDIPVQAQLDRWYGMVSQPDGGSTRDASNLESWEANGVKVTVADMTGTMPAEPGTVRMIAAAIEHANGPHFLKAVGPADTMERWANSVMEYLKSATVEE